MEKSRRTSITQRWFPRVVLRLTALAVAVIPLAAGCITPGPTSTAGSVCDGDNQYCGRPVPGMGPRRIPTPSSDRDALRTTDYQVAILAMNDGWCLSSTDRSCNQHPVRHRPTDNDVHQAENALLKAGYPHTVIRLARSGDPAPAGALLYAVSYEDLCLIGHALRLPPGNQDAYHEITGQFADGRCL